MSYDGIGYSYVDGCDCISILDPSLDYWDEDVDFQWDQEAVTSTQSSTAAPADTAKQAAPLK